MNCKHTSFPPFDFLQPGRLKFIKLFKVISSTANDFRLNICNDKDKKQLQFISQTYEGAIYTEMVIFWSVFKAEQKAEELSGSYCWFYIMPLWNGTCVKQKIDYF